MRLARALWEFRYMHGHYGEGREWLEGALSRGVGSSPAFYAKALTGAGILDLLQCEYDRATGLLEECLAIFRKLGDRSGVGPVPQSLGSIARERVILAGKQPKRTRATRDLPKPETSFRVAVILSGRSIAV